MATPALAPNIRAKTAIKPNFNKTGTTSNNKTIGQLSITKRMFNNIPIVIKNKPSNTSRKGLISSSTCSRYSVSEISMPAINAPNANDSPAISVIHAAPKVMSKRLSMNNSCERRCTTMRNQRRNK